MPPLIGIGAGIPFSSSKGAGGPFVANYTLFDNSTPDYIINDNNILGGTQDNIFTLSFVIGKITALAANQIVMDLNDVAMRLRIINFPGDASPGYKILFRGRDQEGAQMVNSHNDEVMAINTLYHVHLACDFSGASQDVTFVVNANTTVRDDSARADGDGNGFQMTQEGSGVPTANFMASSAGAQPFGGCMGPLWFKRGIYETDPTIFADAVTFEPKDWATDPDVLLLGDPEVFIKNWLQVGGVANSINNYGSTADLLFSLVPADTTVGNPVTCAI